MHLNSTHLKHLVKKMLMPTSVLYNLLQKQEYIA
jgi:hypothetical protein